MHRCGTCRWGICHVEHAGGASYFVGRRVLLVSGDTGRTRQRDDRVRFRRRHAAERWRPRSTDHHWCSPQSPTLLQGPRNLPGDYNNGTVDAPDFTIWRNNLGNTGPPGIPGDGSGPATGVSSTLVVDDGTGLVLNFEVSNRRAMTLRECFAIAASNANDSQQPMTDASIADLKIEPARSWYTYELHYSPGEDQLLCPGPDRAPWRVDGNMIHEVQWGTPPGPPQPPVVKPIRLRIGLGIFTLLDDLPDGRGGTVAGLNPNYEPTVFGQGVTARWRNLQFGTGLF